MTDFAGLLSVLAAGNVEFVLVGGVAGWAHGSPRATSDVDVVYRRTFENIERLANVLNPLQPALRGAPAGLPFKLDAATLKRGLNFTLSTTLGDLDLLGEIAGGGTFDTLLPHSSKIRVLGAEYWCLNLEKLIEVKRAAGRRKDMEAVAELEALREEKNKG